MKSVLWNLPKAPPKTIEYRSYRKYDKSSFIEDPKETDWNMVDFNGDVNPAVEMWNTLMLRTDTLRSRRPVLKEQNTLDDFELEKCHAWPGFSSSKGDKNELKISPGNVEEDD